MKQPPKADLPKEAIDSFRKAGLGSRYFNRTLGEFGELGKGLTAWLNSNEASRDVNTGSGRSIWGNGMLAHDLFMILARGVHARGFQVRIISLSVLTKQIETDNFDPMLEACAGLFVYPFYDADYGECPLTKFQRLSIEDLLFERMSNAKANFTLSRNPLKDAKSWWSRALIAGLERTNVEIGVRMEDIRRD